MTTKTAKKPGQPVKIQPARYVTVSIPIESKRGLEAIGERLEEEMGFGVSLTDVVKYPIKNYTDHNKGAKK